MRTLPILFAAAATVLATGATHAQMGVQTPSEMETRVSDVFLGQNKKGPYVLAWKNVRSEQVTVIVDGVTLRGDAYDFNAEKGTISFRSSLKPQSVARVDYGYVPAKASRNANPESQPITVPLLSVGGWSNTSVQMTALPGDGKSDRGPLLVWGLSNRMTAFGGGLTSQVLLAPDAEGGPEGSLADRAGLRLGYELKGDRSRFDLSFQRSGRDFAGTAGKTFGLAEQTERWSMGGSLKPSGWMAADLRLGGSRDLAGRGSADQNALTLRLWGFNGAPLVTLARAEDVKADAAGQETTVQTEKVSVSGKAGVASYTAQMQQTATDAANSSGDRNQQDLSAAVAAASKDKKASASVEVASSTTETGAGSEERDSLQVKTALKPANGLTLSAETRLQTTDPVQGDDSFTRFRGANAEFKPSATTKLGGSIKVDEKGAAENTVTEVNGELKPMASVKLAGSHRVNDNGTVRQSVTEVAGEVKPFAGAKVFGTHRRDDNGEKTTAVTDVNAEAKALRYVALSGGLTDRDSTQADTLDTTRARMALQPLAGWSLSGGVVLNPEANGTAVEALRQEYGLQMRVGALQLGGGYSLTTLAEAALNPETAGEFGEWSLNVGLRFSRYTSLTGGLTDAFFWGAPAARGARIYSLGLDHNVGSAVNFSLSGTMTEDKATVGAPADVKANAKLGLKF